MISKARHSCRWILADLGVATEPAGWSQPKASQMFLIVTGEFHKGLLLLRLTEYDVLEGVVLCEHQPRLFRIRCRMMRPDTSQAEPAS